jgi:hypothetical protein
MAGGSQESNGGGTVTDWQSGFEKLCGRKPTDKEIQTALTIQNNFGIRDNDAIFPLLVVLGYYQKAYADVPDGIKQSCQQLLNSFKSTAEQTAHSAVESAKADMAKAVASTAQDVARNVAARGKWKWAAGCIALVAIALGSILGFDMYRYEKLIDAAKREASNSGYAIGYEKAMSEKARDAWANTPDGQRAYKLSQDGLLDAAVGLSGSLTMLYQCSGEGWKTEPRKNGGTMCWPWSYKNDEGKTYQAGWLIR